MGNQPDEKAGLEAEFPEWKFSIAWTAAGSGPDGHVLVAQRGDVKLSASTAAGLRLKLQRAGG